MIPRKLLDEITRWMNEGRYGHLQINFSGGKILNVNRVECIKIDMLGPQVHVDCTKTEVA